jgi:hypothetical protein
MFVSPSEYLTHAAGEGTIKYGMPVEVICSTAMETGKAKEEL